MGILFVVVIMIYMIRMIREYFWTETFEEGDFTEAEEELYRKISEGIIEKTGKRERMSCIDKKKFLDNKILKKAYGANASSDCFKIATEMCESTKPEMYKVEGHFFAPRDLIKTYKDTPLPTFTKLGCFDMHYGCCLQARKGDY